MTADLSGVQNVCIEHTVSHDVFSDGTGIFADQLGLLNKEILHGQTKDSSVVLDQRLSFDCPRLWIINVHQDPTAFGPDMHIQPASFGSVRDGEVTSILRKQPPRICKVIDLFRSTLVAMAAMASDLVSSDGLHATSDGLQPTIYKVASLGHFEGGIQVLLAQTRPELGLAVLTNKDSRETETPRVVDLRGSMWVCRSQLPRRSWTRLGTLIAWRGRDPNQYRS